MYYPLDVGLVASLLSSTGWLGLVHRHLVETAVCSSHDYSASCIGGVRVVDSNLYVFAAVKHWLPTLYGVTLGETRSAKPGEAR